MDEGNRRSGSADPKAAEIIIRLKRDEDSNGQASVIWSSWHDTYPGMISDSFLEGITLERMRQIASAQKDHVFVAEYEGRVVGTAIYGPCRNDDLTGAGEIYALYILKECRGKGAGRKLAEACMNAMNSEMTAVWAVSENTNAIRFYESCGFVYDRTETHEIGGPVKETRLICRKTGENRTNL